MYNSDRTKYSRSPGVGRDTTDRNDAPDDSFESSGVLIPSTIQKEIPMKIRSLSVRLLIVVMLTFTVMAFLPNPVLQEPGPVLTEGQLVTIGFVASAALWVLRVLASRGYQLPKEVIAIGLYVISFGLAVSFTALTFPPFPPYTDPASFVGALLAYAGSLLALASPVAGMAYLIYNVLLKRVLESMFPTVKVKG
jgi:hypothetical protein